MNNNLTVCIAFLGNPDYDSRVTNLSNSLHNDGYRVRIIGFDWQTSGFKSQFGEKSIFQLKKRGSSLFFYIKFAFILLRELLSTKAGIYFAEDIYTLPFVVLVSKLKRGKVYYESRELYAYLGGLRNQKKLQNAIKKIEKFFIRHVEWVITTGKMDSEFLENFYGIKNTIVLRNLPLLQSPDKIIDLRSELGIPEDHKILLYQGVILDGRGISLIIKSMSFVEKTHLVILGQGEKEKSFKRLAAELRVADRIHFMGVVPQPKLINYTTGADIGVALIENISISYYYALPNKLFEYIMAGLPVLCSDLPQMQEIVKSYNVGLSINIDDDKNIVEALVQMISDEKLLNDCRVNCKLASKELNWVSEYSKVKNLLFG